MKSPSFKIQVPSFLETKMAAVLVSSSSSLFRSQTPASHLGNQGLFLSQKVGLKKRGSAFRVQAAKLPEGVIVPKVEPKFQAPFLGFTRTAEIWNSRACMIGLIGVFIVELVLNKGVLQIIGVDVGKGLNLPL